jgi:hypothetical protein
MIQRIQTLFLFLAAAGSFTALTASFATAAPVPESSALFADGAFTVKDDALLMGMMLMAGLVSLIAIFLYQKRPIQSRLGQAVILLALASLGLIVGKLSGKAGAVPEGVAVQYGIGCLLPAAVAVLAGLAVYFIGKDEKLVKSMDRLR